MLTFDQAGELLDEMAEEFPPEFYRDLNGGISLLPEALPDPEFPPGEMYTTLAHEFTHHVEGLAGERGLDLRDALELEEYRARAED